MPFRFGPGPQLFGVFLASIFTIVPEGGVGIVLMRFVAMGLLGSLLLQLSNLTIGGVRKPDGPMSPKQIVLTFLAGLVLCLVGTTILVLVFGTGIMVTPGTVDRMPLPLMRNPAAHMGLVMVGWNVLVMAVGFYVALAPTAGILALYTAIARRSAVPAPDKPITPLDKP